MTTKMLIGVMFALSLTRNSAFHVSRLSRCSRLSRAAAAFRDEPS